MNHRLKLATVLACSALAFAPRSQAETVTFEPSSAIVSNPERGLYEHTALLDSTSFANLRNSGITLVYGEIYLPEYRTAAIAPARLEEIGRAFDRIRNAGLKVFPRVLYNTAIGDPDASLEVIALHLGQLDPVFESHSDVILFHQAGFIGSWGEWHNSTNNLTSEENRAAVIDLLLEHLPEGKFIQLRQPVFKWDYTNGRALLPSEAFQNTALARLGHHNDCFLSSPTDMGTYPEEHVELWKDRIAHDTQFVPIGGETCQVSEFAICDFGVEEMERLRWTYLNRSYHPGVVGDLAPCWDEIQRRLGYRFELVSAEVPDTVETGEVFQVSVTVRNSGFAPIYNPRPIYVRAVSGQAILAEVSVPGADPRRWLPDNAITFTQTLQVDAAPDGEIDLALWLPDPSDSLRSDSLYAIRFTNDGVWNGIRGDNVFATVSNSSGEPEAHPRIVIDGSFDDWAGVAPSATDPANDHGMALVDYTEVSITNDARNLYLRLRSEVPYLFTDWNVADFTGVFFDTDLDAETGYAYDGPIGSEFLLQGINLFDQRNGSFNAGKLAASPNGAPQSPTSEVEFAIPLDAEFADGERLFPEPGSAIRLRLYGDTATYVTEELVPNTGTIEYTIRADETAAWVFR